MAKENMQMGEGFAAEVKRAQPDHPPEGQTKQRVLGWGVILALLSAFGFGGTELYQYFHTHAVQPATMQEGPGLSESVNPKKMGGVLKFEIMREGVVVASIGPIPNTIVNAGETALRDCFGGTGTPTCTPVQNFKFHGLGTSSAAIAETDTGCTTELTTQYNPDNTRATGSQTNNGANIYRTVGTNTFDASATINEFCLMSQAATGGGTMWTRILTGAIAVVSGDSIQTTYDLTIE